MRRNKNLDEGTIETIGRIMQSTDNDDLFKRFKKCKNCALSDLIDDLDIINVKVSLIVEKGTAYAIDSSEDLDCYLSDKEDAIVKCCEVKLIENKRQAVITLI